MLVAGPRLRASLAFACGQADSPMQSATLKVNVDGLMKRLGDHARAMSKTQIALEAFRETRSEDAPRARPAGQARIKQEARKREQR